MKLINTNSLNRRRIKTMLKALDPFKQYIRVKKNGIVIRKNHWYSCKREVWVVTDIFIALLPKMIARNQQELSVINTRISAMLYMSQYTDEYDIVAYLWSMYIERYVYPKLSGEDTASYHINTLIDFKRLFKHLKASYTYTSDTISRLKIRFKRI